MSNTEAGIPLLAGRDPKSDRDLFDLALGITAGRIFTSQHIPEEDAGLIGHIFQPFGAMEPAGRAQLQAAGCVMLYGGLEDAVGQVRAYPVLGEFDWINQGELTRMTGYLEQIEALRPPERKVVLA